MPLTAALGVPLGLLLAAPGCSSSLLVAFGSLLYVGCSRVGLAVLLKPCRIVGAGLIPILGVIEVVVAGGLEVAHGVCWLRQVFLGFDNALLL